MKQFKHTSGLVLCEKVTVCDKLYSNGIKCPHCTPHPPRYSISCTTGDCHGWHDVECKPIEEEVYETTNSRCSRKARSS